MRKESVAVERHGTCTCITTGHHVLSSAQVMIRKGVEKIQAKVIACFAIDLITLASVTVYARAEKYVSSYNRLYVQ